MMFSKHLLPIVFLVIFPLKTVHALTVQELIVATIATHPNIQSVMAQREAALIDVETAKQQFYPTPSISLEQVRSSAADLSYGNQSNVQLYRVQQPLWTGGRLTAGLNKAQANAMAAGEGFRDVRQQMALRATQSWSDWYLASLRVKAQEKGVQTHRRLMGIIQRRVSEGAMAPSELNLTQSRLDQAMSQLQSFSAQMRVARLRVAQLIGRNLSVSDLPELSGEPVQCDADTLKDRTIEVSAALKKLKAQQDALGFELQERQAELMPELFMRLERQRSPTAYGITSVTNDRIYVGLSSRFGAGLSNLTALESLSKRRDASQAEYEAVERTVIETVQSELEQLISTNAKLPLLRNALASTSETEKALDRQFLAGRRAWIEVLNAARETVQAEIELGDANASQVSSQWRLSIYCGQQEEIPLEMMSRALREIQK